MPEYAFTENDRKRWAAQAAAAVAAAAGRVRASMAAKLGGALPSSPGAVFNQEEWLDEIDREIEPAFAAITREAGSAFAEGVGAGSAFTDNMMRVMVGLVAAEVAGMLGTRGEVVADRVEQLIDKGSEQGWDGARLADELGLTEEQLSGPLSDALAEAMGNSAATAVAEGAAHGVIDLAGMTGDKTWHCMFRNSRDSHMDADLQTVPVDEVFVLENGEGMYPGDPDLPPEEAINCQCWLTYSVELPDGGVAEGEATAEEIEAALAAGAGAVFGGEDQERDESGRWGSGGGGGGAAAPSASTVEAIHAYQEMNAGGTEWRDAAAAIEENGGYADPDDPVQAQVGDLMTEAASGPTTDSELYRGLVLPAGTDAEDAVRMLTDVGDRSTIPVALGSFSTDSKIADHYTDDPEDGGGVGVVVVVEPGARSLDVGKVGLPDYAHEKEHLVSGLLEIRGEPVEREVGGQTIITIRTRYV